MKSKSKKLALVAAAVTRIPCAVYAAPAVELFDDQPGLNVQVPFTGDVFGNTYKALPTQWGGLNSTTGIDPISGRIVNDVDNGFIRYNTTMKGQNPAQGQYTTTAMSTGQDWVMSMEWESNMKAVSGTVFEASHATNDVARFESYQSSGQYRLLGGDGSSGAYSQIAVFTPGTIAPDVVHTLTLHYQASNSLLDFYIDGALVADDFRSRGAPPAFGINFVQLGGTRVRNNEAIPAIDAFDNIKVGLVATGGTWAIDGSGDWNSPSNWNGLVPGDSTATARFGSAITVNRSVYTDIATTVGGLKFDNANRYVIGGAGTLSVESASGTALVEVIQGSHKINLPLIFASNANVSVSASATLTLADPVLIKANKTVTRVGTGSLLIQAPLTIESGGTLAVGAAPLMLVGAASLEGSSRINVGTQSISFDHSGQAAPGSVIEAQLTTGHNGGAWSGEGIMTSAGDATKGLGWVEEGSNKIVKVKFTYYGDSNLSGTVDSIDFTAFLAGYGLTSGGVWANGDYNYDDKVNTKDFNYLAGNFGLAAIPSTALGSVVPEPSMCGIGLSFLAMMMRRRRFLSSKVA